MEKGSGSFAEAFAANWIDAWNRHDIDAILSHYSEDVIFLSPVAAQRVGHGRVIGREALRSYWSAVTDRSNGATRDRI
jgi:ketosteroid isomerase-like protein